MKDQNYKRLFICVSSPRSCRLAPLIQCDYCPLLFHMDCLDPPLTAFPAGKWMCPNHVEHLVVGGVLSVIVWLLEPFPLTCCFTLQLNQRSLSLSSRCQLFDQFQDRISQHAVKVDFLRRVHRRNAPNRRSSHQHYKKTMKVTASVGQYFCFFTLMSLNQRFCGSFNNPHADQTFYCLFKISGQPLRRRLFSRRLNTVNVWHLIRSAEEWPVCVQVPDAIKAQYQSPPSMLLPAGVRQLELICGSGLDPQSSEHLTTEAEQEQVPTRCFYICWKPNHTQMNC